jgi:anaphase-promoting complex subunit 8
MLRERAGQGGNRMDGYLYFLHGIVLKEMQDKQQSVGLLLKAIALTPLHWGAWLELASLFRDVAQFSKVD